MSGTLNDCKTCTHQLISRTKDNKTVRNESVIFKGVSISKRNIEVVDGGFEIGITITTCF